MEFKFRKGTVLKIGTLELRTVTDTLLEAVGIESFDALAEALAAATPAHFGDHVQDLVHTEVQQRDFTGLEDLPDGSYEVDVLVSYGAGGVRIETVDLESVRKPKPKVVEKAEHLARVEPDYPPTFPGYPALVAARIESVDQLRGATIEQLETIPGIAPETAQLIYKEVRAREEEQKRLSQEAEAEETERQRVEAELESKRVDEERLEAERLAQEAVGTNPPASGSQEPPAS